MDGLTPIQAQLFALQDLDYRTFHCKLMPTVDPERVIGVRTPQIRQLAKQLSGTPEGEAFLQALPHRYYEENNLHGARLSLGKSYSWVLEGVNAFLPYVDNWATCDLLSPKVFRKHLPELREEIPAGWQIPTPIPSVLAWGCCCPFTGGATSRGST